MIFILILDTLLFVFKNIFYKKEVIMPDPVNGTFTPAQSIKPSEKDSEKDSANTQRQPMPAQPATNDYASYSPTLSEKYWTLNPNGNIKFEAREHR